MWLEIDGTEVIGVHSARCDNSHQWIEYDGPAKPGDQWIKGKLKPRSDEPDPVEARRIAARARITAVYPLWDQINILREGNAESIAKMGRFIDACRDWSNGDKGDPSDLAKIES